MSSPPHQIKELRDWLVGMFDSLAPAGGAAAGDANNMPDQLLDDYLTARMWLDAQPAPEGPRRVEQERTMPLDIDKDESIDPITSCPAVVT